MGMITFPHIRNHGDSREQLEKVMEEVAEALAEDDGTDECLAECIDVLHAADTLETLLFDEYGFKQVMRTAAQVIEKNMERGYYK